eukprot:353299-Chlamydomonas_euryale.AAC.10
MGIPTVGDAPLGTGRASADHPWSLLTATCRSYSASERYGRLRPSGLRRFSGWVLILYQNSLSVQVTSYKDAPWSGRGFREARTWRLPFSQFKATGIISSYTSFTASMHPCTHVPSY